MIFRLWKTHFKIDKHEKLIEFAQKSSKPYLANCKGNRGVFFCSNKNEWITVTLWEDISSIEIMENDPAYQELVKKIDELGILIGKSETIVYRIH